MAVKKWILPKENKELSKVLAKECQTSELVATILVNRGKATPIDAMQFLNSDIEIGSPYELTDMQKAVERIQLAIEDCEKIVVYGDYDCDGITSTAILYSYLTSIGADAMYYIPEREGDGYGLNKQSIKNLCDQDVSLIITVDNGITAIEEIAFAKTLGIDVVITDHHQPLNEMPDAVAIVNPHQKGDKSTFKELCGAGVVFKLIIALEEDLSSAFENFADLVAIGTIGDIVPLIDENRAIVKSGLEMFKNTNNMGIRALLDVCKIDANKITAQNVAFGIVPRINAAGRMGSATLALELLLAEDEETAKEIAIKLDEANKCRQNEEKQILEDIELMMLQDKTLQTKRVLILEKDEWNSGIIGIVCSKLLERYGKPVMILTADGQNYKGSARSLGEFHLFKALNANANLLMQFGGHKFAAGFSVHKDDFDEFKVAIEKYARENFDIMPANTVVVDKVLTPEDLTIENINQLAQLGPFGARNEEPKFMIKDAIILEIIPISQGKHLRLTLEIDKVKASALYFGVTPEIFMYKVSDKVDAIVNVDINEYNDKKSVSIKIKDMRSSMFNAVQNKYFMANGYYEKLVKSEEVDMKILNISIPSKKEIAGIHKLLIQTSGFQGDFTELYIKCLGYNLNYCKLRIILDILEEFELISFLRATGGIKVNEIKGKIDLNEATILKRLGVKI